MGGGGLWAGLLAGLGCGPPPILCMCSVCVFFVDIFVCVFVVVFCGVAGLWAVLFVFFFCVFLCMVFVDFFCVFLWVFCVFFLCMCYCGCVCVFFEKEFCVLSLCVFAWVFCCVCVGYGRMVRDPASNPPPTPPHGLGWAVWHGSS